MRVSSLLLFLFFFSSTLVSLQTSLSGLMFAKTMEISQLQVVKRILRYLISENQSLPGLSMIFMIVIYLDASYTKSSLTSNMTRQQHYWASRLEKSFILEPPQAEVNYDILILINILTKPLEDANSICGIKNVEKREREIS